jgi:hypothetical protein
VKPTQEKLRSHAHDLTIADIQALPELIATYRGGYMCDARKSDHQYERNRFHRIPQLLWVHALVASVFQGLGEHSSFSSPGNPKSDCL